MSRRRALIAAQKGETLTIADLNSGTGIKFGNYVFIIVDKAETHVSILRDTLLNAMKMYDSTDPTTMDYEGTTVDTYLTTTYYNAFGQSLRNLLVDTNISYAVRTSSSSSTKTITRKVCVPNESEVASTTWLNALKAYYGVTTANEARSSNHAWWLRDAYTGSTGYFRQVKIDGSIGNIGYKNTSTYIRPLFFVSPSAEVYLDNGVYVVKS